MRGQNAESAQSPDNQQGNNTAQKYRYSSQTHHRLAVYFAFSRQIDTATFDANMFHDWGGRENYKGGDCKGSEVVQMVRHLKLFPLE
ncbi:MAG: hypothetical protein Fur0025_08160 [Oscillatoriaceae cyanobacterium]